MAAQILSATRQRGARPAARVVAGTTIAGVLSRPEVAPFRMEADRPRKEADRPRKEAAQRGTNGRWLSDVDAWALPFDLACGGSGAPAPRAARGDTYEVWS